LNEDLRFLERGVGHRIEVFRNGHCEYLVNVQNSVDQTTLNLKSTENLVIDYVDLAQRMKAGVGSVFSIWGRILPFKDMTLSILVLNAKHWMLYSCRLKGGEVVMGFPIESDNLRISTVVANNDTPQSVFESIIRQFVNFFGLVLNEVFDNKGTLINPDKLRVRP
jgi:hypothetical protein